MAKQKSKRARISAVVCVYNREDTLPDCLAALASQTLPESDYEVLVVDNNSTDSSWDIANRFAELNPNFLVLKEMKQGLAAARNCGIKAAASDIAAFTDDDAIPSVDWLERLTQRFESLGPDIAAIGGELEPLWRGRRPAWLRGAMLLRSLSVCLEWSKYARDLSPGEWLCEANSAYRIGPVIERGGFPENLGRIGNNLLSGENAVNELLLRDGYRFFFDPEIIVSHQIPPSRMTREWFRRRFFWGGVTQFFVTKYLIENGCATDLATDVMLPMDEPSWAAVLNSEHPGGFEASLHHLYGLGYAVAASKLLVGR